MERVRALVEADLQRMNIGKRFWGVHLSEIPKLAKYREVLEQFISRLKDAIDSGMGLFLYGDYRKGKTSAAAIVAKAVVAHGGTAFFIRADDLTRVVVERTAFDDEETVEERMRSVDLLIIDDLGSEHSREFGESLVERVVRWRYDHRKSLVVTVNVPAGKLEEKFNEGLMKVMRSMMSAVQVDGTTWFERERGEVKDFFQDGK